MVELQNKLYVDQAAAIKILNAMPGGDQRATPERVEAEIKRRLKSAPSGVGEPDGVSNDSEAFLEPKLCMIELTQRANDCAADILDEATLVHERVHQAECKGRNKLAEKAEKEPVGFDESGNITTGKQAPRYETWIFHNPTLAVKEEIEAYEAGSAYIRQTYKNLCRKSLK